MTNKTKQIEMLNRALNLPSTGQEDFHYDSDIYEIDSVYLQIKGNFTEDEESKFKIQYFFDLKTGGEQIISRTEIYPAAIISVNKIKDLIQMAENINNIMSGISGILL